MYFDITVFGCYRLEGCDLSCNLHTGLRICLLSVVEEDLRLRNVAHAHMTVQEKRHTLELLLREEEEFLKLQMYVTESTSYICTGYGYYIVVHQDRP